MIAIDEYCDICFETHQRECAKIARVIYPTVQRQLDLLLYNGTKPKPITVNRRIFTAAAMAYIALYMIVEGQYYG